jgi:hypothetical protein
MKSGSRILTGLTAAVMIAVAAPGTAQAASKAFDCSIGRTGADPCGSVISVGAGRTLKVALASSGGWCVYFKAYNNSGHHNLGSSGETCPGSADKKIWTNDTGRTINVQVEADASGLYNVRARGTYKY